MVRALLGVSQLSAPALLRHNSEDKRASLDKRLSFARRLLRTPSKSLSKSGAESPLRTRTNTSTSDGLDFENQLKLELEVELARARHRLYPDKAPDSEPRLRDALFEQLKTQRRLEEANATLEKRAAMLQEVVDAAASAITETKPSSRKRLCGPQMVHARELDFDGDDAAAEMSRNTTNNKSSPPPFDTMDAHSESPITPDELPLEPPLKTPDHGASTSTSRPRRYSNFVVAGIMLLLVALALLANPEIQEVLVTSMRWTLGSIIGEEQMPASLRACRPGARAMCFADGCLNMPLPKLGFISFCFQN